MLLHLLSPGPLCWLPALQASLPRCMWRYKACWMDRASKSTRESRQVLLGGAVRESLGGSSASLSVEPGVSEMS